MKIIAKPLKWLYYHIVEDYDCDGKGHEYGRWKRKWSEHNKNGDALQHRHCMYCNVMDIKVIEGHHDE